MAKDFVHLNVLPAEPPGFVFPWCASLVAEELSRAELAQQYPAGRHETLDLIGILTSFVWAALALGMTEPVRRIADERTWVTLFESWSHEARAWVNALLISFSSLVRRSSHQWP